MLNQNLLLTGDDGYNLTKSLRFRSSASAYLNRTPASAGNRQKWTWSGWVKRGELSPGVNFKSLFGAGISGSDRSELFFYDDKISVTNVISGVDYNLNSTAVFRDTGAWYHVVLSTDTTQSTAANRVKIYINNANLDISGSYPTQNVNLAVNNTVVHYIGENGGLGRYFDGYMADINFIDGQALTPSSFGQTSTSTGVWIPKKYTGTYGTNGFYLPFTNTSSTSTLGNDFSGNNNTWTVNNISLTSGATYDSMKDVPTLTDADTANYCTLNPLASRSVGTMQNGNLTWKKSDAAGDNYCCASSISIPSSGKWYWEVTVTDGSSGANSIGIIPNTSTTQQTANTIPGDFGITTNAFGYYSDGTKRNNGSSTAYGNSFTTGDIIGVAVDTTNSKIWWSKNGTFQASGDPAAGTNAAFTTLSGSYYAASSVRYNGNQHDYNFGQRPFAYTPPTGFVALNTFNLPTPTIGATASTQANKYMDATLWAGNSSTQSITNSNSMKPDFVWIKSRNPSGFTGHHVLTDSVRGATITSYSNLTDAEQTVSSGLTAFNSNGFSLGGNNLVNSTSINYVGWQWRASNTTAVTNTAGSITSTVSANTTAGFSIATYTGNGSTGATIGHGLGVTPSMIIVKKRSSTGNWITYHTSTGINQYLYLNSTSASNTASPTWGVSSTTITFQQLFSDYNDSGVTYVAYCFAQVAGYSAFGSYTGNGNANGTFVFTGFRPRFVLIKKIQTGAGNGEWYIHDTARDNFNQAQFKLYPSSSVAENGVSGETTTTNAIDILSNGFKLRTGNGATNESSISYIYAAFAESPFKFSNAR